MKKISLLVAIALFLICSCKQEPKEEETMFDYEHIGILDVTIINTYPAFTGQCSVNLTVDANGKITSSTGTLTYSGESEMPGGQSKMKREGSIDFSPYGECVEGEDGDYIVNIFENATGYENMKMWVWDGNSWVLQVEVNNIPIEWNGGLAFSYNKATSQSGDIIEVQESTGAVQFKLTLTGFPGGIQ